MTGDFYIGGRQFDRLSDLIGYYTHVSFLLKGEQLVTPVPPPEVRLVQTHSTAAILQSLSDN